MPKGVLRPWGFFFRRTDLWMLSSQRLVHLFVHTFRNMWIWTKIRIEPVISSLIMKWYVLDNHNHGCFELRCLTITHLCTNVVYYFHNMKEEIHLSISIILFYCRIHFSPFSFFISCNKETTCCLDLFVCWFVCFSHSPDFVSNDTLWKASKQLCRSLQIQIWSNKSALQLVIKPKTCQTSSESGLSKAVRVSERLRRLASFWCEGQLTWCEALSALSTQSAPQHRTDCT